MDLYALPPGEFTAARDDAVRQARRDKNPDAVRALQAQRRPSVAAYAVNRLVRAEPDLLDQLLTLGAALARAQSGGDAGALRQLGTQRRGLVEAVADRAAQLADGLGPGPRVEVVATLDAAMVDPASAEAVRTGRLVHALSYAGFGGADLSGAVASADTPRSDRSCAPGPAAGGEEAGRLSSGKGAAPRLPHVREVDKEARGQQSRQRTLVAAAEADVQRARGALDDTVRDLGRAQRRSATSVAALEGATKRLTDACTTLTADEEALTVAAERLAVAEEALTAAREEAHVAGASVTSSRSAAHDAEHEAERARGQAMAASGQVDRALGDVSAAQQATERAQRNLDDLCRS